MDPNATLEELRTLLQDYMDGQQDEEGQGFDLNQETAMRVADLFEALDDWLRAGGGLPEDWGAGR